MQGRRISDRLAGAALLALLASPAMAGTTAFAHFTLVDGSGKPALPDAAMIVADDHIAWVGKAAALKAPAGARLVDLSGKFVIPGLIDNHVHLGNTKDAVQDSAFNTPQNVAADLHTYAAYGVTSVQVLGTDKDFIFGIRDGQRHGHADMARVFTAGQGIVFKGSYGGVPGINQPVATAAEARAAVDVQAKKGVDFIKFWLDDEHGTMKMKMPYDIAKAVIEEAHKNHLKVVAHIFYKKDAETLIGYGINGLVHSVRDQKIDKAFAGRMKAAGTWQMAATLSREASFTTATLPFLDDPFFSKGVSAATLKEMKSPAHEKANATSPEFPSYGPIFANAMANFKTEADDGVSYGLGTDSGPPGRFAGYFAHWEMELMVQDGLTPLQALTAATGNNAKWLGAGDIGILEPSRKADFVVLDADPLSDIHNARRINAVYIDGAPVPTINDFCAGSVCKKK